MRTTRLVVLFALFCTVPRVCSATCVLESDFGVVINCAFKKSSLFRIRNLGGVKAHLSWGLTIGDELGLKESISNTDTNRRRAAPASPAQVQLIAAQQEAQKKKVLVVPPPDGFSNETTVELNSVSENNITSQPPGDIAIITSTIPPVPTLKQVFSSPRSLESSKEVASVENEISQDIVSTRRSDSKRALYTSNQSPTSTNGSQRGLYSSNQAPTPTNSTFMNIIEYLRRTFSGTTPRPIRKRPSRLTPSQKATVKTKKPKANGSKVGVAPREYHPVGYSRNITTGAPSRLKLPKTSFQCKDQKYFPGLYADEELGCSVFHVCAILDTGELVTRSFLCPESSLFDQTILKCNWWFYVDCTTAKKQYDINMPVARSYQLMKALSNASSTIKAAQATASVELDTTTPNSKEYV